MSLQFASSTVGLCIKQLLDLVFVISEIIKVSWPSKYLPSASSDNNYLDLDYSRFHKNLIQ